MTLRVVLSAGAFAQIARTCLAHDDGLETGGVLLGHQHADGLLSVTGAGEPGPNARRTRCSFRRDAEHARALARGAYARDRSVWLGDWHTHPDGPTHPSPLDLRSYAEVLQDPDTGFEVFLAIIVAPQPSGPALYPWAVTAWTASQTGLWVEQPG